MRDADVSNQLREQIILTEKRISFLFSSIRANQGPGCLKENNTESWTSKPVKAIRFHSFIYLFFALCVLFLKPQNGFTFTDCQRQPLVAEELSNKVNILYLISNHFF